MANGADVSLSGDKIVVTTPAGQVMATGTNTVTFLFWVLILAAIGYSTYVFHADHLGLSAMIGTLKSSNDEVFLSNMMTEDQKKNLPAWIKDRMEEKMSQKAEKVMSN